MRCYAWKAKFSKVGIYVSMDTNDRLYNNTRYPRILLLVCMDTNNRIRQQTVLSIGSAKNYITKTGNSSQFIDKCAIRKQIGELVIGHSSRREVSVNLLELQLLYYVFTSGDQFENHSIIFTVIHYK
jgi:hypothetical protein